MVTCMGDPASSARPVERPTNTAGISTCVMPLMAFLVLVSHDVRFRDDVGVTRQVHLERGRIVEPASATK